MGDYYTIMTGGWWQASDGTIGDYYTVMTHGWWTGPGEALPVAEGGLTMDLTIMHQMGMIGSMR